MLVVVAWGAGGVTTSAWGWGWPPHAAVVPAAENLTCLAGHGDGPPQTRKLGFGTSYEARVGPTRSGKAEDEACSASVVDDGGRSLFQLAGYNVTLDGRATGLDFDGDGTGDVVFRSDSGGGQHCCWSVTVVSLRPSPRKLFEIDAPGLVRFETGRQGRILVWQRVPGPSGFTDVADRPFAERAFQYEGGKLVDVTAAHCRELLAPGNRDFDQQAKVLTPERLAALAAGQTPPDQEVASALWSRILQRTFCHRFDDALKDLDRWPASSRAHQALRDVVKNDYPDFAKRLLGPARNDGK